MIVVPNPGPPREAPRAPIEPEIAGVTLVRFGDVLAAVQLRRDPDAAAEASPHVADVFNARGFFGHAQGMAAPGAPLVGDADARNGIAPSRAAMTPDVAAVPAPALDAAGAADAPADPVPAISDVARNPTMAFASSRVERTVSASLQREPIAGQAVPPRALGLASVIPPRSASSSAPALPAIARSAPRAPARPARDADAAAPQVVVRAGEAGVEVVARVDRLGDQARATLRARIAALLSRHGFSGGVVRLIGGPAARKG